MFPNPDLLMVLTQQLSPNNFAILGHDAHQPIDVLRMFTDQF